jgi:hypothetical protein
MTQVADAPVEDGDSLPASISLSSGQWRPMAATSPSASTDSSFRRGRSSNTKPQVSGMQDPFSAPPKGPGRTEIAVETADARGCIFWSDDTTGLESRGVRCRPRDRSVGRVRGRQMGLRQVQGALVLSRWVDLARDRARQRGMVLLMLGLIAPALQRPGVVGQGCQQVDGSLVVDAPGRQPLAVEGALELRVEGLGVLAHSVEPAVIGTGRGSDAQVLGAVEPGPGVRI